MTQHYLVSHRIERYPDTQDEWLDLWEKIHKRASSSSRWMYSYYDPSDERLYRIWKAGSEDLIEACFKIEDLELAPIEDIRQIAFFDIQALSREDN